MTRHTLLTLPFLLLALLLSGNPLNAQNTLKADDPGWQKFKSLFMEYDSMTVAFRERQANDPEFAANPQEVAGEEITRYQALAQEVMQSMPQAAASAEQVEGFDIDDYRALKFFTMVTEQMNLFPIANKGLIERVEDQDSARQLKMELAQVSLSMGDYETAQEYATKDVVENADPINRAGLYSGFSDYWMEKKDMEKAQEWALRAISTYAEAEEADENNPDADPRRVEWIRGRYGALLAPLMYELKEAGDAEGMDELTALAKGLLPETTTWTYVKSAMNSAMSSIEKERETLNQPAEPWAEHIWIGSDDLSLETLKGRVVLIDFFATWCQPCIRAFPHIRDWQEKYEDEGLTIVGLTSYQGRYGGKQVDKEEELARLKDDFIPNHDITWAVGVEKDGRKTMTDYGVQGIPYMVLIDREGKIQYTKVGAADYNKTEQKIQELLKK